MVSTDRFYDNSVCLLPPWTFRGIWVLTFIFAAKYKSNRGWRRSSVTSKPNFHINVSLHSRTFIVSNRCLSISISQFRGGSFAAPASIKIKIHGGEGLLIPGRKVTAFGVNICTNGRHATSWCRWEGNTTDWTFPQWNSNRRSYIHLDMQNFIAFSFFLLSKRSACLPFPYRSEKNALTDESAPK